MRLKNIYLILLIFIATTITARSQGILKKMKEKASGTADKKADNTAAKENEKGAENSKNKVAVFCFTRIRLIG